MKIIKKIKNNPQEFFDNMDKKVSSIYGLLGFEKNANILPKSDPLYWGNILNKIRLAFCVVPILFILWQIYESFLIDNVTAYGNLDIILRDLLSLAFWWLLITLFLCFIVVNNFSNGKEQNKGNDEIQIVHIYYMYILPTLIVVGGCLVLFIS